MMSFHHRKLLNDSIEDSIIKFCEPYCDPLGNQHGDCPLLCLSRCNLICNRVVFEVILLPPPPPPPPAFVSGSYDHQGRSYKLSFFFTLSLAVLAATFLIFSLYTAYKFYKGYTSRRSQPPPPPPPPPRPSQPQEEVPIAHEYLLDQDVGSVVDHPIWYIRTVGLQSSVIALITTCKYKRGDGLVEGTECSVCLNEFQDDETLRLLPKCQHAFHLNCIDTWLRSHVNCPLCRAPIVRPTANSELNDVSVRDLAHVEPRVEENGEYSTEGESEVPQVSIRVDDNNGETETRVENDFGEDVGSSGVQKLEEDGFQPLRRSVSMDSLAASVVSAAIVKAVRMRSDGNLDKQLVQMPNASSNPKGLHSDSKDLDLVCSSSIETPLPKGNSSMVKRSLSCSAKVFLSRYSRSRSSYPPPPP